jgi:amidase
MPPERIRIPRDRETQEAVVRLSCLSPDSVRLESSEPGVLAGRTFVVKDLFAVAGHTSSFGHPRWRETHGASDVTATVVAKLRDAGATMLGLTKLDQLAYSLIGNAGEGEPPINPLYPDRFTGGSSSGTASAVAGGVCDFGVGTDTAGSIRVPAASCGLFALRPTHGVIDSSGALPLAPSFDVVGILARGPAPLRDAVGCMVSPEPRLSAPLERVLIPTDCLGSLGSDLAAAIVGLASLLRERIGVDVEETSFARFTNGLVADLFARLQAREIWATHSAWLLENRGFLAADVQARLVRAELLSRATDEEKATDMRAWWEYARDYEEVTSSGTVILLPVMPGLPPRRSASSDELLKFRVASFRWNAPSSLTGSAQAVVPVRRGVSGLTYGVGLLGIQGQDSSLLAALCSAFGDGEVPLVVN